MNVKVKTAAHHAADPEAVREISQLIENLLRPIDSQALDGLELWVEANKYFTRVALMHQITRLAEFSLLSKGVMHINYASKTKMNRLLYNSVGVSLMAPGSIERIQDMVKKSLNVYIKWLEKLRTALKARPEVGRSVKKQRPRIAYRRR